ncbi:helix-turn-helix domain-containing protein [Thalassolituus sp. UBA2009]|jgi:Zn-dependent peptidase ImmA (M78 family)/transcriptional regulator with XRE-family HTH domain|uniref:helix-turn-helix domain-containing protein n=1 Tax=Thalassolituus sp. UBA2009 TaxID=1947658 RepID=UPI002580B0FD|nr:XRE family transcriptional regulator [Thalassolituus sp. UBA2009]
MMASTAQINHRMLTWARERSGIALPEFAAKCGVTEERLMDWEEGKRPITFNQAQGYANKAHVPFGYLFLHQPPLDELPIPDLRTLGDRGVDRPSAELLDLIKLTIQRQQWYRDYLLGELADPCDVVGRGRDKGNALDIVSDMRQQLSVGLHPTRGDSNEYYRKLVEKIESLGVLVMRESFLGHYTRMFRVDEFRGFAIADEYAPVIFVNHADAPGPRLFTLIHELCHIWLGITGLSDGSEDAQRDSEKLCNAVAAEFLVPEVEFRPLWKVLDDWKTNLPNLEAHFRVSKWVIARRALTLGYISAAQYQNFISKQIALWKQQEKSDQKISHYRVKNAQISSNFSKAVISQAFNGHLLLREAGELLNVKPANIKKFANEVGI